MYYTVTFNPAVDMVATTNHVALGRLNRLDKQTFIPGGKGINMSVLLNNLGLASVATGFVGGFTGQFVKENLEDFGISTAFTELSEPTRVNVKINTAEETEINGPGPEVKQEEFDRLTAYLSTHLSESDLVFLAGNKAPGMTDAHYEKIAELVKAKGAELVVDTNTSLLLATLAYKPLLIKPNIHELGEIFDQEISQVDEALRYAGQLQDQGARNILISMGGDGALLLAEDGQVFQSQAPSGKVINPSGAGDSMVAGFIASFTQDADYAKALRLATASGSATAFSSGISQAEMIHDLLEAVKVEKLN